jgi:hypothetical protein
VISHFGGEATEAAPHHVACIRKGLECGACG